MIAPDVNILVGALRADAERHGELQEWLENAVAGPEPVGLTPLVLSGTVRIITHPRIFTVPSTTEQILELLDELLAADGVELILPGPRNFEVFSELCRKTDARGSLVADAQHAAIAIEHGATWVTLDRDFARFPGLRWRTPWE